MTIRVSDSSVELIRQHLNELNLSYPLDEEHAGYAILKYFEEIDADIGGLKAEGKHVDEDFVERVNKVIEEFFFDNRIKIDYEDLERRLKN